MSYRTTLHSRDRDITPTMMEVVLNRLRDFSCKTYSFDAEQSVCSRDPRSRTTVSHREDSKLDLESALAWLRRELMEMRSQDQALIRQLMELHSGIQELKLELSEEDTDDDDEEEEEESSDWDSDSEEGSGSAAYSSSGETIFSSSSVKQPPCCYPKRVSRRGFSRRRSVP